MACVTKKWAARAEYADEEHHEDRDEADDDRYDEDDDDRVEKTSISCHTFPVADPIAVWIGSELQDFLPDDRAWGSRRMRAHTSMIVVLDSMWE